MIDCEEEEAGARAEVEEAMETQVMEAEEALESAKENLLDAEDAHFATMLALTEAERGVEAASAKGAEEGSDTANAVMVGAQQAAIKTEKALRFAQMERDKTKNKLDGVLEDQFFRAEAQRQHAEVLVKIARRQVRVKAANPSLPFHFALSLLPSSPHSSRAVSTALLNGLSRYF